MGFFSIDKYSSAEEEAQSDANGFGDQMFTVVWAQGSVAQFGIDGERFAILGHSMDGQLVCCHACSAHSSGLLIGVASQPDFYDGTLVAPRRQRSELLPTHIQRVCFGKRQSFIARLQTSDALGFTSIGSNINASRTPLRKGRRQMSLYMACPTNH